MQQTPRTAESMRLRHDDLKAQDWESPEGRFGNVGREHKPPEGSGCPFELEHYTLRPGKRNFPFHAHGAMWELYYVLSGTSQMRTDEETVELEPGDSYLCRPGLAHQLINNSDADFVFVVVANNPTFDAVYFPDSEKLGVWETISDSLPQQRFWKIESEEIGYFTDEE